MHYGNNIFHILRIVWLNIFIVCSDSPRQVEGPTARASRLLKLFPQGLFLAVAGILS